MLKLFYFLSPVEVVKVTSQNLQEVAEWCGGSVQTTESRKVPGRMDSYVLVPTPKDTNISWAFPGMFITKRLVISIKNELRTTYAVFRRDYFEKNYFETPGDAVDKTWEREEAERKKPTKKHSEVHVNVNVGQALLEAQKALAAAEEAVQVLSDASVEDVQNHLITTADLSQEAQKLPLEVQQGIVNNHNGGEILEARHDAGWNMARIAEASRHA